VSPEAVESKASRRALVAIVVALGVCNGYAYLLPLYMQVVQGYDSQETAIWMLPYALSLSAAAVRASRLADRFTVRAITRSSMLLMAAGFVIVGTGIADHWGNPVVVLGLVLAGAGTGAVLTLGATVMVGASGPALASEVGGLRHAAGNLGAAVGTALVGALLVTALNLLVDNAVAGSSVIPPELKSRAALEQPAFISNDDLEREAEAYGLPPAQVREVVRINTDGRLGALRICFFGLAAMALLGAVAARGLPDAAQGPSGSGGS
jgi:MFS family permease